MSVRTIEDHLSKLIETKEIKELTPFVSSSAFEAIRTVLTKIGDQPRLKPIKEALPGSVTYGEIKIVKSWLINHSEYVA